MRYFETSYNYPQTSRDYVIRKLEGGLLIIFSIFVFLVQVINIIK